jgi:hypothetical protein
MKSLSRHAISSDFVQEGIERKKDLLVDILDSASSRASALSIALSTARSYAGFLAAADAKVAELCRALRIGAQASAAIFALASGGGEIGFPLSDRRVTLPTTGPTDATHAGNWRIGWWLAQIVRERTAIDRLASTPIDAVRRSSSRADDCQYLFIEALQGFDQRMPDWSTKLQSALDATDPEQVRLQDEQFVLDILVPEMQMLFHFALGEIAPFNEALEFAVDRHKKYWSKGDRKRDPDGFLALGPLAISCMAFDAGMPIHVKSEYIPQGLVENACSNVAGG